MFLEEISTQVSQIKAAVFGLAGPVEEGGNIPVLSNI
jgi:hypothetical protein